MMANRVYRRTGAAPLPFASMVAAVTLALSTPCLRAVDGDGAAETAGARPPDIVIILADDQTWTDSGCYGHPDVRTPNIDRLAAGGMRFTHAFTATAMCAPTRQQLYTGVFPVRNGAYPNHSKVYPGTRSIVHHLSDLGYRVGLAGKKHFGPPASFPFEAVRRGARGMAEFIGRDAAQPYCLVVTSNEPHLPWDRGDPSAYDADKLTLPPYLVDTPETRRALTRYYAEVTAFDAELGEVLDLVEAGGRAAETLFIYSSEQGAQFPRGKWTCYDTGLRVALVVRWPRRVAAGSVSGAMVQYVDVVPTLVEAAGGAPVPGLDGRSFLPVLLGQADEHRDVVFGAHTTRGIINGSRSFPVRSARDRRFKYIWNLNHTEPFSNVALGGRDRAGYWNSWVEKAADDPAAARLVEGYQHRPEEELYDLEGDPFELENRAADPALTAVKARLRARLLAWMQQQGDRGNETELARRPHRTGK